MKGVASYLKFESHLDKNQVGETFFANHNILHKTILITQSVLPLDQNDYLTENIIRISCKMAKR